MTITPPPATAPTTPQQSAPPEIFDRKRRQMRRDRMAVARERRGSDADFLAPIMAERLEERFEDVQRNKKDILLIGAQVPELGERLRARELAVTVVESGPLFANAASAMHTDEDQLIPAGLARGAFDMILWNGGLDSVNDVPGALIQCRALLKPDGVLAGMCLGAGTLSTLRSSARALDSEQAVARFHPQIDVRAMGDLLHRCGFVMPMADAEELTVRYRSFDALIADMRASGLTNVLAGGVHPISRSGRAALDASFMAQADDEGRVAEYFSLLSFIGWAPPAPAHP